MDWALAFWCSASTSCEYLNGGWTETTSLGDPFAAMRMRDDNCRNLLHYASQFGQLSMVQFLLPVVDVNLRDVVSNSPATACLLSPSSLRIMTDRQKCARLGKRCWLR